VLGVKYQSINQVFEGGDVVLYLYVKLIMINFC
jgi:hypothetical protein